MPNQDVRVGWKYHDATKHSFWSVHNDPHFLDWDNQPLPFKIYKNLEAISLPGDFEYSTMPALAAIGAAPADRAEKVPTLRELAHILHFAGGITKRRKYPGGEILFRAASCTGALYEIELYVVCGDLDELAAGVYHWSPRDHALYRLRGGDHRDLVVKAAGEEPAAAAAPVLLIGTGTYWRNAWKYQARTYRHFGWDGGTILANLLTVAAVLDVPAKLVQGFVDRELNRLLDVDEAKEVALSVVALGRGGLEAPTLDSNIELLGFAVAALSETEGDYPLMREMHEHSSLADKAEVARWRGKPPTKSLPEPGGKLIPLEPLKDDDVGAEPVEEVIRRRGSTREFARVPIAFPAFSTILDRATRGVSADFLQPFGRQLNDLYLIVNGVDGLAPGAYFFHRAERKLELLKDGEFREDAGYLGLEQQLPADASAAVFFLADLDAVFQRFGNRGYRAVQTEAGIIGGKIYLSAYAQRLGASGLTFYDDEVVRFFSPHAEGKSAIFLTAVGKSLRALSKNR